MNYILIDLDRITIFDLWEAAKMSDPAIIEAAARALQEEIYQYPGLAEVTRLAMCVLAAVTPLIEVAALEKAAIVAERFSNSADPVTIMNIARAIRALKKDIK